MLSALELNGFKSFADRTRFEFPAGITVVVGPNGSGKSNVVDSIKWVLGSQSIKSLRGKEMTDVIFSGSRSRRPANAAEASLVFDNSAGLFDHDASEIQITRRAYRSGDAEYLINRQPCRLRDVRDLLAGGGIGSGSYCIIEQGRVDAVLQASPKERRVIFEEAAGVSRFRIKREEAARRLEKVQQNLLRLADIVEELETRLRTVRSQAGKAQKYSELSKRLEQLRTHLAVEDWRRLAERIDQLCEHVERERHEAEAIHERLTIQDATQSELEKTADELQRQYREAAAAEASVRERLAQSESARNSHLARIDELDLEVQRLAHQLLLLNTRAGDSQQLLTETKSQVNASDEHHEQLQSQLSDRLARLAVAEAALNEAASHTNQVRQGLEGAQRQIVQLEHEIQLTDAKLLASQESLSRIDEELEPLNESRQRHTAEFKQATAAFNQAASELELAARELKDAQTGLAEDRSRLEALIKHAAELDGRIVGANERIAVLEELEFRLEGLTAGAKHVLRLAREEPDGPFGAVRGVVADLLHVDADSASLVEIALGERAHHLVMTQTQSITAALDGNPTDWPGRTTFLRLDVPYPASAVDRIDLSTEPGVIGRADSFVETSEQLAPLARRLLGRFWFVDALPTALRLANGLGRGLNFVTVAGETVLADGAVTVGPRQSLVGLLSRRSELRALREQVSEMQNAVVAAERERLKFEERIAQNESASEHSAARHGAAVQAHAESRHRLASISEKLQSVESRLASLTAARQTGVSQVEELTRCRDELTARTDELQRQRDNFKATLAESSERIARLEKQIEVLRQEATEHRIQLAGSEQRVDGLKRQLDQLQRDHAERDSLLEETRLRAAECQKQKLNLQELNTELIIESGRLADEREQLGTQRLNFEQQIADAQSKRSAGAAGSEEVRHQLLLRQRQLQGAELELQQLRQQRQALSERFQDEYHFDLAERSSTSTLADNNGLIEPAAPRETIEAEILDLRGKLQATGPVNVEALAELESLEARYNTLSAQYQDLHAARERLEQIVQQINGESRQLFLTAIDTVRQHFKEIFSGLHAGGEADILVEDDPRGDILECGVSVIARPPGKQPRSVSLLSGGERTLTCVALLLAIFRSRPSPFCVLDEVDAALDGANIDRFVGVLKQFMHSTQFIVITHSKRTMTCSDTLYGVTMQESGVSKRVSVRFEDVSENGEIRPAALRAA
jgi:chromosome segregation protein